MERDERVVYEFVKTVVAVVAACDRSLILHVRLPPKSRRVEPVDQVGLRETVYNAAACAAVECRSHYADVVGLARPR